ncbi:MAG: glycosyltransferase family 39 protein [Chthoniobacterales bacterium]
MKRGWWLLLFAVVGLWLNTRQNHFPFYYHPDEVKKVDQILSGERNFNHPLLMLNVVELAWKAQGSPADRQRVVELGRETSAVFCVIGTLAFMLAAWRWRGPLAGVAAGAFLTSHQQVFELAHYFKEDPALYAGVGLFAWAAVAFYQRPTWTKLVLLAVSLALAASAKYLGAILILPALVLVWCRPIPDRKKLAQIGILLALVIGGFVLINLPIFFRLDIFEASFGKEMNWAVSGEKDVTRSVPHSLYLNIFVDNTTPLIWLLLAAFGFHLFRRKPADRFLTWCLLGTLLGWMILLSFSPKTNDRYFLPLTGLIAILAAAGFAFLAAEWKENPKLRWLPYLLVIAAVGWEIQKTQTYLAAFAVDDRVELVAWIDEHIPATETIGYDTKVNLPDIEVYHDLAHPLPHRLLRKFYAADLGTPEYFEREKIRYLIITESAYGRFFLTSLKAKKGQSSEFERRTAFYQKLREQPPLWSRPRSTVLYLHPGLEVYRYEPARTENK